MLRAFVAGALVAAVVAASACSRPPETFELDGPRLTVHNRTSEDWVDVELWLNHYFRLTVRRIAAGATFRVGLDQFVDSYGRRFNRGQIMVDDLRLKAKGPGGEPLELVMAIPKGGLAGALGGKK